MKIKKILSISLVFAFVIAIFSGCSATGETGLNYDQAIEKLNAYIANDKGTSREAQIAKHTADPSIIGSEGSIDELPPIDKYPLSITGKGQINVEIFSSTEKSGTAGDKWFDIQAKAFNDQRLEIGGKTVSVSIRPIASGLALDYIKNRSYIPDAYSPANELWGSMIDSIGVPISLIEKRLTGNVAGILMKKDTYANYTKKYGAVTIDNVVKAVMAKDVVLGHTNPNVSSTGLNIFTQELRAFDNKNPFSTASIEKLREFQGLTPPASPTTAEMAKVAAKGILDSMIMESQAYSAEPTLSDWKFEPCGVRHDSPLYAMNNLSAEKTDVLRQFAEFCKTAKAQKSASDFGFNQFESYVGPENKYTGQELFSALKLWKENKDGGNPVISVFIVDRSGSMEGAKLNRVKEALRNSIQYINEDNYIGLVSYSSNNDIKIDLPIGKFTPNQQALFAGAVNDFKGSGITATNSAIVVALDMVVKQKALVPNAKIRILVLSDGDQNDGLSLYDVQGLINGIAIPLYGVGFEANLDDLKTLADINEGYCIDADSQDVIYQLKNLFIAQL